MATGPRLLSILKQFTWDKVRTRRVQTFQTFDPACCVRCFQNAFLFFSLALLSPFPPHPPETAISISFSLTRIPCCRYSCTPERKIYD